MSVFNVKFEHWKQYMNSIRAEIDFRVAQLRQGQMKNVNRLKLVTRLAAVNQGAKFQHSYATLKFIQDICT